MDPRDRWSGVDADGAWDAALTYWKANSNKGFTFINVLSDFFNYNVNMECGTTAPKNSCNGNIACSAVDYPAGAFILNSLSTVSMVCVNPFSSAISIIVSKLTERLYLAELQLLQQYRQFRSPLLSNSWFILQRVLACWQRG